MFLKGQVDHSEKDCYIHYKELFNNYSSGLNGLFDSEAMRARGIVVLVKSN